MINLGLNLLVVITLALINGVDIRWDWLLLPLVVIELYIFAQAVAFFLAALNVKFRDTGYIWEIVLQAGFYVTPIIYPLSLVPEQFQKLILLNPVAQIIQDARYLFVWDQTVTIWDKVDSILAFLPPLIVALTIITAVVYFKKRSHTFAEDI
jgi:ABC-2 type transport system permease protein